MLNSNFTKWIHLGKHVCLHRILSLIDIDFFNLKQTEITLQKKNIIYICTKITVLKIQFMELPRPKYMSHVVKI